MRRRGFTLVEILVAVAVLAVIGVSAARSLASLAATSRELALRRARLARVEMFFALLGRDLVEIAPERIEIDGETLEPFALEDDPPGLGLLRSGPVSGRPFPGTVWVRYGFADHVLRREVRFLQGVDAVVGRELLTGVRSFTVAPVSAPAAEPDRPRVPAGVRVEVEIDGLGRVSRLFRIGVE